MKKHKLLYIISAACFLLFAVLIVVLRTADVMPIGPENTEVGLATLNGAVHEALGFNPVWYGLTAALGYVALAVAAFFAGFAVVQGIKRRSIKKIDVALIAAVGLYAAVALFYVVFELAVVNYRPVVFDKGPEASFPSSHTLIACCVFATAITLAARYIPNKPLRIAAVVSCATLLVLTVVGRLLSGVHWLTDIIGGTLLSGALVALYLALVGHITGARAKKQASEPEQEQGAEREQSSEADNEPGQESGI